MKDQSDSGIGGGGATVDTAGCGANTTSNIIGTQAAERAEISPYFALCIIIPDRIDELHLGGNQKRFIHSVVVSEDTTGSGCCGGDHANTEDMAQLLLQPQEWTTEEVNP